LSFKLLGAKKKNKQKNLWRKGLINFTVESNPSIVLFVFNHSYVRLPMRMDIMCMTGKPSFHKKKLMGIGTLHETFEKNLDCVIKNRYILAYLDSCDLLCWEIYITLKCNEWLVLKLRIYLSLGYLLTWFGIVCIQKRLDVIRCPVCGIFLRRSLEAENRVYIYAKYKALLLKIWIISTSSGDNNFSKHI
jgi:hypothetical protein